MSVNEYFLEAVVRFRGDTNGAGRGASNWEDLVEIADALFRADVDPINGLYGSAFDRANRNPITKYRRNSTFGLAGELGKLHVFADNTALGAEIMQRLVVLNADFSTPEAQEARIDEAHSVGEIASRFISAAQELATNPQLNPLEFAFRRTTEIKFTYATNPRILQKLGASFDKAVVGLISEDFSLTSVQRETLTDLARLGRVGLSPLPDRSSSRRRSASTPKP